MFGKSDSRLVDPFVYLDNNVLRKLTRDRTGQWTSAFNSALEASGLITMPSRINLMMSPIAATEALGFKFRDLIPEKPNIPEELLKEGKSEELKGFLFSYYSNGFLEQKDELRKRIGEALESSRSRKREPSGENLIRVVWGVAGHPNFVADWVNDFSYDLSSRFELEEPVRNGFIQSFILDVPRALGMRLRNSQAAVLRNVWTDFGPILIEKGEVTEEDFQASMARHFAFKKNADFVDAEMTYKAVVGVPHQKNYHPAICLTCDDENHVSGRLALFRSLVSFAMENVRAVAENEELPFDLVEPVEGSVILLDSKTLEYLKVLKPSEIDSVSF